MKASSIYTSGAFVYPVEMKDVDGNQLWQWVVSSFEDDSYEDGVPCRPVESAEKCEGLLLPDDDDEQ